MQYWLRIPKLLRILIVGVVLCAAFASFAAHDGIQYTLALVTGSFSKPVPDTAQYTASPNCDGTSPCSSGTIKVMTYNVLCRICDKEGYDPWDQRLPHLQEMIAKYDPDLYGSQELGGNGDIETILSLFPQFGCVSYKLAKWAYADCALFYRKDRFEALDSGQFWLSPKPHVPFATAWKKLAMPRYVNWVYLRQKSNGFRFLYVNTHFDNNSANKEPSAVLFAKTFKPIADVMPIIATGDFNTDPTTTRYKNISGGEGGAAIFHDVYDLTPSKEVLNNLPPDAKPKDLQEFIDPLKTIDHVFLAGPVKMEVARWIQDATAYAPNNRWPSDHPAVFAEVNLTLK